MNRLGQFILPAALFAFVGAAQAAPAPETTVTFGPSGSGAFTWDRYEINEYKYVPGASASEAPGYQSMASKNANPWMATNYREASPALFSYKDGLFDLNSLWLAGGYGSVSLTITGFVNNVETYSTTVKVTTEADRFFFTGFTGIDSFSITTGADFVKDPSVTVSSPALSWAVGGVNVAPTTAVPEPETYAMLLAGLALVGAVARRRRMV